MKLLRYSIIFLCCMSLYSCAASAPRCLLTKHIPELDKKPGILIITDVCIQYDAIGEGDDYLTIKESQLCAEALHEAVQDVLKGNGVNVHAHLIPFACGSFYGEDIQASEALGDKLYKSSQPLGINEKIRGDTEYVNALSKVGTYASQQYAIKSEKNNLNQEKESKPSSPSGRGRSTEEIYAVPEKEPKLSVSSEEFKKSINIIAERSKASAILFVNMNGNKISSGKRTAQNVGKYLVGMTTAVATGVATAGLGTGFYVSVGVFPQGGDGRIIRGTLIDVERSEIAWEDAIAGRGDPTNPGIVANKNDLQLLLRNALFKPEKELTKPDYKLGGN